MRKWKSRITFEFLFKVFWCLRYFKITFNIRPLALSETGSVWFNLGIAKIVTIFRKTSFKVFAWKVSKYRDFSGSHFPVFWPNTEIYGVNQSEYRKIQTRKNSVFGHSSHSESFCYLVLIHKNCTIIFFATADLFESIDFKAFQNFLLTVTFFCWGYYNSFFFLNSAKTVALNIFSSPHHFHFYYSSLPLLGIFFSVFIS